MNLSWMDTSNFSLNYITFMLYARQSRFVEELDKNVFTKWRSVGCLTCYELPIICIGMKDSIWGKYLHKHLKILCNACMSSHCLHSVLYAISCPCEMQKIIFHISYMVDVGIAEFFRIAFVAEQFPYSHIDPPPSRTKLYQSRKNTWLEYILLVIFY